MEEAITEGVQVQAEAFYLEMHSLPEEERYVFAYRIRLKNLSQRTVQLLRRHWIITDSNGEINEVHGEGVVVISLFWHRMKNMNTPAVLS